MAHYLTLSPTNQFSFVCPIFDTKTNFRQCGRLRDIVYVGGRPPVRKGCQACIKDAKCPAAEIIRKISFGNGLAPDDHGSMTPVQGKLSAEVLEKIAPVMVMEHTLNGLGVSSVERALIATANERIEKQLGHAPRGRTDAPSSISSSRRRTKPRAAPAPAANANVNEAAATGNLAAAVSA